MTCDSRYKNIEIQDLDIEVSPNTRKLLEKAEELTDLPLIVNGRDNRYRSVGGFRLATNGQDYHEIHVDTNFGPDQTEYTLAHELTHAIRAFSIPPEERRIVTCYEAKDIFEIGVPYAREAVERGKYANLQDACESFTNWLYEMIGYLAGPEEIEVDKYVWKCCPELRNSFTEMMRLVKVGIRNIMNGASPYWEPLTTLLCSTQYPILWIAGYRTGDKLTQPFYGHQGVTQMGNRLLEIVKNKDDGHLGDIKAAEQWIETLGVQDLFRVVSPYEIKGYGQSTSVAFFVSDDGEVSLLEDRNE